MYERRSCACRPVETSVDSGVSTPAASALTASVAPSVSVPSRTSAAPTPRMISGEPVRSVASTVSTPADAQPPARHRRITDLEQLLDLIREGCFAAPSRLRTEIPPGLERIVMRCLAPRAHRYPTARALVADLSQFLQTHSPQFVTNTLASLVGVVLDRAGYKRPAPEPPPEPSWSSAVTNPLNKRQGTLVGRAPGPRPRPRATSNFDEQFDDMFGKIEAYHEPGVEFAVDDPSKQIVINLDHAKAD